MSFSLARGYTVIQPKLASVLSWHHNNILCALVQWMMMPSRQRHSSPWLALSGNSNASLVVRGENAFSCISRWVLGPSQGEMPVVLFIQYQRCWCLNLNKEGHWTELSVWLPFRTAVNAILLIRLLKASLPTRSLCEGNTMQAVQTPQKGIALESHTSAVWPLAMLGRSVDSLWTPSQLQSGNRIDSKSVIQGVHVSEHPGKWQRIVSLFTLLNVRCRWYRLWTLQNAQTCFSHLDVTELWFHVSMWSRMFHLCYEMHTGYGRYSFAAVFPFCSEIK